jgi:H+/Cl- antiporter ClcA
MEPDKFRELNVELSRQPLVNQRPWWIAGLLLAFIFLLFTMWNYCFHKKRDAVIPEKKAILKG